MTIELREAVLEWREARRNMSTISYLFERTKKGNEFAPQIEIMAAWTRLANAEYVLMTATLDSN